MQNGDFLFRILVKVQSLIELIKESKYSKTLITRILKGPDILCWVIGFSVLRVLDNNEKEDWGPKSTCWVKSVFWVKSLWVKWVSLYTKNVIRATQQTDYSAYFGSYLTT